MTVIEQAYLKVAADDFFSDYAHYVIVEASRVASKFPNKLLYLNLLATGEYTVSTVEDGAMSFPVPRVEETDEELLKVQALEYAKVFQRYVYGVIAGV